jgi:hypothetical protein
VDKLLGSIPAGTWALAVANEKKENRKMKIENCKKRLDCFIALFLKTGKDTKYSI